MLGEKILIVDNEPVIREMLSRYLVKEGFLVITDSGEQDIFNLVCEQKPDLVLLDILLPKQDGGDICQELRKVTNIPIIFTSSKNDPFDIALGLGIGGDDYITKPFSPIEVVARAKAHLRRYRQMSSEKVSNNPKKQLLEFRGLTIDLLRRTVKIDGCLITLTAKEFDLLSLLTLSPNQFFSANNLMELIWQTKNSVDYRTLMVHISKLRKKIEKDPTNPRYIITVKGMGYKFSDA